jgi:predicted ATP-grasp superfamily ATP-dependent carboligase
MTPAQPSAHNTTAIVIGLDTLPGLQTARILASHGIPVIAIASDPGHHCCRTKVCDEIHYANARSPDFLAKLNEIAATLDHKAVLYPCLDPAVLIISAHRAELENRFLISLADSETVDLLTNKVSFYRYAEENGLSIPKTFFLKSHADAVEAAEKLEFPGVLKPSVRLDGWDKNTSKKAFKVDTAEELLQLYERCHTWTDTLIFQEWIEGGDDSLYSCNCYFDANSNPLATFVARKIRQWPPGIGFSSLGEEVRDDFVRDETLRLFSGVNYRGLGYVEFKRDTRTGESYIIEPNVGRPTGRSAIAEAGGVELLYTMYCDVLGLPLPAQREQTYSGAKWIDLRHDFQSALHYWRKGELSLGDWRRSWQGKKAYAYFAADDIAPFLHDLFRAAKKALLPDSNKKQNRTRQRSSGSA